MKHLLPLRIVASGLSWLFLGALVLVFTSASAEYKLQVGDTLEISVTGVADLRQRSPIGLDGYIAVPLVGQIKVGGLSLSGARGKITGTAIKKANLQLSLLGEKDKKDEEGNQADVAQFGRSENSSRKA